ncbi:hypothetical protein SAMN04489764_4198 [Thermostaphylospora chromogena]|uniref:Uncharacterized protein n=1 Tax=Thermostaphylospora chromogena TaxID=35622 RepID=A0A1H1H9V7_9ACTN|nr:hypothetical protein SAMN04489764_4198 [Thermostaphylospora chromogena]
MTRRGARDAFIVVSVPSLAAGPRRCGDDDGRVHETSSVDAYGPAEVRGVVVTAGPKEPRHTAGTG